MQAILAKIYCDDDGNMKISVSCSSGRKVFFRDELHRKLKELERTFDPPQMLAAEMLASKLGWDHSSYGKLIMGTLKNGDDVFVFTGEINEGKK